MCDPVYSVDKVKSWGVKTNLNVTMQGHAQVGTSLMTSTHVTSPGVKSAVKPCVVCGGSHKLFSCEKFLALSPKQRYKVVFKHRLCFNCLMHDHVTWDCRKTSTCSVPGCGKKHAKLIHVDRAGGSDALPRVNQVTDTQVTEVDVSHTISNFVRGSGEVYLPMVQVRVNGKCDAYALLDSGSTGTFITERLARSLQLDGTLVSYKMNTLGSSSEITSKVVSFNMAAPEGESVSMEQVLVVDDIPARLPEMKIDLQRYPHLTGLPLLELKDGVRADILIGMDKAHILMPLEVRSNPDAPDQPYVVSTLFGWSVSGTVQGGGASEVMSHFVSLDEQVERLWQLETHDEDVRSWSPQDHQVVDLWNNEIRIVDGPYELPIHWKDERPCMPYNRHMAVHRLKNLTTKLNKNGMMDKYSENLVKMLDSGYAEPVSTEELSLRDGQVWYLPHHVVLHVAKPGKVRLVFDCAAKQGGISLNSQCFRGPDLNNKLLHVLLRFRQFEFAIMADIEAMYLQVKIPEKDGNCLRFLWQDGDSISIVWLLIYLAESGVPAPVRLLFAGWSRMSPVVIWFAIQSTGPFTSMTCWKVCRPWMRLSRSSLVLGLLWCLGVLTSLSLPLVTAGCFLSSRKKTGPKRLRKSQQKPSAKLLVFIGMWPMIHSFMWAGVVNHHQLWPREWCSSKCRPCITHWVSSLQSWCKERCFSRRWLDSRKAGMNLSLHLLYVTCGHLGCVPLWVFLVWDFLGVSFPISSLMRQQSCMFSVMLFRRGMVPAVTSDTSTRKVRLMLHSWQAKEDWPLSSNARCPAWSSWLQWKEQNWMKSFAGNWMLVFCLQCSGQIVV